MTQAGTLKTIVFAPPYLAGGVKSLYSVCEWMRALGPSTILPFHEPKLADWFKHSCELYDFSYLPDLVIYPEVYQPEVRGKFSVCFALGKYAPIRPHANLTVGKSTGVMEWVTDQYPWMPTALILPSINREVFEYDGRRKQDLICYMPRPGKHPEMGEVLRKRYGQRVVEIVDQNEDQVAETLKSAKVFVWRGNEMEGSPRPPKEALVAGCVVVGLKSDLTEDSHVKFGVRCSTERELVRAAGRALDLPIPTEAERAVVRDSREERQDWLALMKRLGFGAGNSTE